MGESVERLTNEIEREIERVENSLLQGEPSSRWLYGYLDGLRRALQIYEHQKKRIDRNLGD